MQKYILLFIACPFYFLSAAQLNIESGASLIIEAGAKVTVGGNVNSNADIQGAGFLNMQGTQLQTLNMNGKVVSNLEINNAFDVSLGTSATTIGTSLLFTNGKIRTSNQDIILNPTAFTSGHGTGKFVWTNGTGQLKKKLTTNISNFIMPVGENNNYRPAFLTTSGSTFTDANAGVRNTASSANLPPMVATFLKTAWPITQTGISGGTITLAGQYNEPTDLTGTEANLAGYYFNGTNLTSIGEAHDAVLNRVSVPVITTSGELLGINKFVTVGARAFLQAPYNAVTGLMSDGLRIPTNIIPGTDPYRTAPYNTSFTHVANTIAETAAATVFNSQASADNDIVDWVFLQLRNTAASPGNTILQTRSALIQRDGDIVDIDGVNPVTFNVQNGSYALSIRHRNHHGISIDPPSNSRTLTENKSIAFTTNLIDLRTATNAQIFGTNAAYTTAAHPTLGAVNLLWGGDASGNATVHYTNPGNDKDAILAALGGVLSGSITNQYRREE